MKYVAFIGLGLVLLLTICGVVLWANMPTARLTIHAVRPMGTNWTWAPGLSEKGSWPVWEVAITNSGRAVGRFGEAVLTKDREIAESMGSPLGFFEPNARLGPGQHTNVFIPLPSQSPAPWTVEADYITVRSSLEETLSSWLASFPRLNGLLPNGREHVASDIWHVG